MSVQKARSQGKIEENLVNTEEAVFFKNLVRTFIFMIARPSSNISHAGLNTRSLCQFLQPPKPETDALPKVTHYFTQITREACPQSLAAIFSYHGINMA